jgi:curved DNA-binding protein CbpA
MKSHYEKLGVTKDASPDEIKRSYRAKAKDLHPDKGGNSAEFAEVATAFAVLFDEKRRLLYDATGLDEQKPIEKEIEAILLGGFNEAINASMQEDIDIVEYVREHLTAKADTIPGNIETLQGHKAELTVRRERIKADGENLAHKIIDQNVMQIDIKIVSLEHQAEVAAACLVALDDYSEDFTPEPPQIILPEIGYTIRF